MKKYTEIKAIRFSKEQINSLMVLKSKGVKVNYFIRQAIKEKLARDWKNIKTEYNKRECPF